MDRAEQANGSAAAPWRVSRQWVRRPAGTPITVLGQMHGAVVQGIGQTMIEHTDYDRDGAGCTANSCCEFVEFVDRG